MPMLRKILEDDDFDFIKKPYTLFAANKDKLRIAVYQKGPKVLIQGKGTEYFIRFRLEPEVLGEARLGYEEVHHPEFFTPHFGIDESGKGDFFGPLVIGGAYVDKDITHALMEAGIQDSKRITSDARIRKLAKIIRSTPGVVSDVIVLKPERYNALIESMGNVNRLLAWGHARVIENLCEKQPDCPRSLSDQFGNPSLIKRALMPLGKEIQIDQRTKAESDPAVAAASILAREAFIDSMQRASDFLKITLPRGASAKVKEVGGELVIRHSPDILRKVAKVHFRTAAQIAPDHYVAKEKKER